MPHVDMKDAKQVLELISKEGIELVDIRFCDLPGLMQHFTMTSEGLDEDSFVEGFGFDGSSIRGFQKIHESDMILFPDPTTAFIDPFMKDKTLVMNCFIGDPVSGESYSRDPRYVAKKAEDYLTASGVADQSYWGPEAEFYIFDDVRFDQTQNSGYYFVDSVEGIWNSGTITEGGNKGYKPRYKEGYFPVPPMDQHQDLRSQMVLNLRRVGLDIEVHHHEVGTAGQA
ncbi:MAG TPA: glutamine synthetase beta-grasp domain-containing protein, partial [Actinomycetota bacterium]|nr:glutamine synthetase beta-grasp domain-containing protein [Actinomycetota bacterium]